MNRVVRPLLLVTLAAAGCKSSSAPADPAAAAAPSPAEPPAVSGADAKRLVGEGAVLLDVRTVEEYEDGHIEGARNLPINRLDAELATLPRDKPIVVYCAVGGRATRAARALKAAGYDARNLGAMAAWSK